MTQPNEPRPAFVTTKIGGRDVDVLLVDQLTGPQRRVLERTPRELWGTLRIVQCHTAPEQQRSRVRPFYLCKCGRTEEEAMPLRAIPQGILDFFLKLPPKHWPEATAVLAREEAMLLVTFANIYDILRSRMSGNGFGPGLIAFGERLSREEREARYKLQDDLTDAIEKMGQALVAAAYHLQNELAWNIIHSEEFPPHLRPKDRQLPRKRVTEMTRNKPRVPAVPKPGTQKARAADLRHDEAAPPALPKSAEAQIEQAASQAPPAAFSEQPVDEETSGASAA